ncbi:hypothetical protein L1987_47788 [Smallanthus sonchifolius]|uniref:Uncharacterized protein n=1 Tax=Smallanthus sonchifolius TaxID=185202 RepID=A0ACB9FQQ4_9ASTR|nr:hypothetical protein L1987_47788 [Smallanthus sonchifolius]
MEWVAHTGKTMIIWHQTPAIRSCFYLSNNWILDTEFGYPLLRLGSWRLLRKQRNGMLFHSIVSFSSI